MASIKDRLQGILNKATVNNTNLGLVLDIIIRKKNEHDEQIKNLTGEKILLETEIDRLKDTNKTASENLENDKNKKEEEIAVLKEEINKLKLSLQTLENDSERNQRENLENIQKITAELESKKEELKNLEKIFNEHKIESNATQEGLNDLNKKKIEELENNLNTANQNLTIEKAKTDGLDEVISSIENELGKTNAQLQNTTGDPFNVTGLNNYPAPTTTGGKSMKMKKHHKKQLKRKTRKIRNKKHKSK